MVASFILPALAMAGLASAQIIPTGPNGPTNPDTPEIAEPGTTVNQTSESRLLSLNSVDDFCIFGPPVAGPENTIGNTEPIVVAYCTKPRNGARLIPDGAIHSAHFVKAPSYVQINGFWDGTKMNIPYGDSGGELDPHGAENVGNPIGGNVTSNAVTGTDTFYEEWMSFVSYDQFCMRICTEEVNNISASLMCEHELDVMGCAFVLPSVNMWVNNSFTSCESDDAAPPGLYPQDDGSTSTFRQRYTGSYTNEGTLAYWTIGNEVTPAAPYTTPAVSQCTTYQTISNGIDTANYQVVAQSPLVTGTASVSATITGSASASTSGATGSRSGSQSGSASRTNSGTNTANTAAAATTTGAASRLETANFGSFGAALLAGVAVVGGGLLVLA